MSWMYDPESGQLVHTADSNGTEKDQPSHHGESQLSKDEIFSIKDTTSKLDNKDENEIFSIVTDTIEKYLEADSLIVATLDDDFDLFREFGVLFTHGENEMQQKYVDFLANENYAMLVHSLFLANLDNLNESEEGDKVFTTLKNALIPLRNGTAYSNLLCEKVLGDIYEIADHLTNDQLKLESKDSPIKSKYLATMLIVTFAHVVQNLNQETVLEKYKETNIVEECKQYTQFLPESVMLMAFVLDENDINLLSIDNKIISWLFSSLQQAIKEKVEMKHQSGYGTLELLKTLHQLAVHTQDGKVILSNEHCFTVLTDILRGYVPEEQMIAAEIIWTLAFTCADTIKENEDVIEALQYVSDREAMMGGDDNLLRTVDGVLWELGVKKAEKGSLLDDGEDVLFSGGNYGDDLDIFGGRSRGIGGLGGLDNVLGFTSHGGIGRGGMGRVVYDDVPDVTATVCTEKEFEKPEGESKGCLMLSYNWGSQETVLKVKDKLVEEGYSVWIDTEQMSGCILEAMANAVEKSDVILMFYTEKYFKSANCRSEATYAHKKKKPMIPVKMQSKYDPGGWLGLIISTLLYYDLSTDDRMEKNFSELTKEINKKLGIEESKENSSPPKPSILPQLSHVSAVPADGDAIDGRKLPSKPKVCEWGTKDVAKWITENDMSNIKQTFAKYDGPAIVQLREVLQILPDFYYKSLKEELKLNLLDTLRFTYFLKKLLPKK